MLDLLLDATAVILASLTIATVAGPSVVPGGTDADLAAANIIMRVDVPTSVSTSLEQSILTSTLQTPAEVRDFDLPTSTRHSAITNAPATPLSAQSLANLSGVTLLNALTAMPPTAVNDYVTAHPQRVHELLEAPPAAMQVSGWWAGLDDTARRALSGAAPELVGNLDGIPYSTRNVVNRELLRDTIRELELHGLEASRSVASQNQQRLQMLYSIADALGPATANPARTLLNLDTHDEGKVAIVLGDLHTADYVSYIIPGMFITVAGNVVEWTDTAARLYDEQVSWLSLLADAGVSAEAETVATVAWIGYQTPHLLNVGSLDLAYEGRDAIAAAIDGLQTVRGGDQPFISLLAHSYGSTAAMLALEQTTTVDAFAMIGSPGAPAANVADLNVSGDVFVGEADWDPIPNSAFFGSDPGESTFGARVMSVAGTIDVITNKVLASSSGHNEYFSPGTESMRNLALIGINKGELVTDGSQLDEGRTLALVL